MNNKIAILGAGESGVGAAILAKKQGFEVFVSDSGTIKSNYKQDLIEHQIEFEEGTHTYDKIMNAKEIIKSPGIPDKVQVIKEAKYRKIPIISEIEFAGRYTKATKICITGTNGKTTTTLLTYHILKNGGLNVGLAGNVGYSFARQVAEKNYDYYVIELSSFQLDNMYEFKAEIAVLLNITPDHLDRYDYDYNKYIDSKYRIVQNLTEDDYFIFSSDELDIVEGLLTRKFVSFCCPISTQAVHETGGAFIEGDDFVLKTGTTIFKMKKDELALKGLHNTTNSLAAGVVAKILDIKKETIRESLANFKGVEHRLENFLTIRGVQFINDSKATNVNAVWYALECMQTNVVLILGGIDKGNYWEDLLDLIKSKVKAIVALGVDNSPIIEAYGGVVEIIETKNMNDAVKSAFLLANSGDTVLLSPACASFDLFKNYEDRGLQFKEAVRNL